MEPILIREDTQGNKMYVSIEDLSKFVEAFFDIAEVISENDYGFIENEKGLSIDQKELITMLIDKYAEKYYKTIK